MYSASAEKSARFAAIEREAAARDARVRGAIDDVLAHPEAGTPLDGDWQGFTRGRALAWCWVLTQFESGNVLGHWRSAEPRTRRAALQAGKVPEGPAYPRRARELESRGLTPHTYRHVRELLGDTPGTIDVR